jgi:hypothetical protein
MHLACIPKARRDSFIKNENEKPTMQLGKVALLFLSLASFAIADVGPLPREVSPEPTLLIILGASMAIIAVVAWFAIKILINKGKNSPGKKADSPPKVVETKSKGDMK